MIRCKFCRKQIDLLDGVLRGEEAAHARCWQIEDRHQELRRRLQNVERCLYVILEDDGNFRSRVADEDYELLTESWSRLWQ